MQEMKINMKQFSTIFILLGMLLLVGCSSTKEPNTSENNPLSNEIEDNEKENDIKTEENEEEMAESDDTNDESLEVKDGNPVGAYSTSDITPFMIIKKHPDTGKNWPGGFLTEGHPYIKEIDEALVDILYALYEIDYKTITADRYKEFLHGELKKDNTFHDIRGEQAYEVITEIKSLETTALDFHDGMDRARVKSKIVYHVLQSKEDNGAFHRYLEGEDYEVLATSEVEKIDGEWKVLHILDGFAEVVEDE